MVDSTPVPPPAILDFHALENLDAAVDAFIVLLGKEIKAGFSVVSLVDMLTHLATDPVYISIIKDYKDFSPEFAAITLPEGIKLMLVLLTGIPRYIDAFKK